MSSYGVQHGYVQHLLASVPLLSAPPSAFDSPGTRSKEKVCEPHRSRTHPYQATSVPLKDVSVPPGDSPLPQFLLEEREGQSPHPEPSMPQHISRRSRAHLSLPPPLLLPSAVMSWSRCPGLPHSQGYRVLSLEPTCACFIQDSRRGQG
jgi:hypothetical protein